MNKKNKKKIIKWAWANRRNYNLFEYYGSWAGHDGKYLRKSTPKNHTISFKRSKLFYFFQLNLKKNKTVPLTPVSTLINASNASNGNQQAKLLIKEVEEKIKIEKEKGIKSETELEEFVNNQKYQLYHQISTIDVYDSMDEEMMKKYIHKWILTEE